MSSKLVDNFLAEQVKLMNAPSVVARANKCLVNPETVLVQTREMDVDETYNMIIAKKPSTKRVVKFLQQCIDTIMLDDD